MPTVFDAAVKAPEVIRKKSQEVWKHCEAKTKPGLEIGPHIRPLFRKRHGFKVEHLETRSTEELIALMEEEGRDTSLVEPIDYILDRSTDLSGNVGGKKFGWVTSSHVVEHIPNFLGHLDEVADVLEDGGRYVLLIPDRNLTFDCMRMPTTLGQLVEAKLEKREASTIRDVIDNIRYASWPIGQTVGGWSVEEAGRVVQSKFPNWRQRIRGLIDTKGDTLADGEFGHQWVFDPVSFSALMADCAEIGMLDSLQLTLVKPTYVMDFLVVFEKKGAVDPKAMRSLAQQVRNTYRPTTYDACLDPAG